MNKEKQFYIDCLKNGKMRHDRIYSRMKEKFQISATTIRDLLIAEGYVRKCGYECRNDGKKMHFYELTGKKFSIKEEKKFNDSYRWEDGSIKSKGNAFDWRNFSKGIYTQSELAAVESGRKFGMSTASKNILPRVSI